MLWPGMAQQRGNALRIGCRIERRQRRVRVDQLAPELVDLPAVHFNLAGYL